MPHIDHPVADYESALGVDGQLVDVREPAEVVEGTLPNALNIPLGDLADRVGELDKQRRVVVLCRSGGRSANASEYLTSVGFTDVVNLAGGMLGYVG